MLLGRQRRNRGELIESLVPGHSARMGPNGSGQIAIVCECGWGRLSPRIEALGRAWGYHEAVRSVIDQGQSLAGEAVGELFRVTLKRLVDEGKSDEEALLDAGIFADALAQEFISGGDKGA